LYNPHIRTSILYGKSLDLASVCMALAIVDGKSVQFIQENLDGENVG